LFKAERNTGERRKGDIHMKGTEERNKGDKR
jgi:hypothetical protein